MTVAEAETATWIDIGGRDEQQDRVAVFESDEAYLLVLADGLGGHEDGAEAAQAVEDAARDHPRCIGSPKEYLAGIVGDAHNRINAVGIEGATVGRSPHSTCVLLHIANGMATWAHVGDSRLYRFENGRLAGRTIDHSVVEMMRLRGRITEEEMKTHPDQNRLYEALGGEHTPKPDFDSKTLGASDAFLLVSDGVWEHVSDAQLEAVFGASDFTGALEDLVAQAKSAGGPKCDNLSVAAWRYRSAGLRRADTTVPFAERMMHGAGASRLMTQLKRFVTQAGRSKGDHVRERQ